VYCDNGGGESGEEIKVLMAFCRRNAFDLTKSKSLLPNVIDQLVVLTSRLENEDESIDT
jgi:hypothetical protein